MIYFENENILKLIMINYTHLNNKQIYNNLNNKMLNIIILKILEYKTMINSLGRSSLTFQYHSDYIHYLIKLTDSNIVSVSADHTMKKLNVDNCDVLTSLEIPERITSAIVLTNGNVITSSEEGLKVWTVDDNFECIKEYKYSKYFDFNGLFLLFKGRFVMLG
jgi:hypothetical protein